MGYFTTWWQPRSSVTYWVGDILLEGLGTEKYSRILYYQLPLAEWLKGGTFRALFNEVLRDRQCSFDAGTVDSLLRGQDQGRNNGERLFALVLFELWRREYDVTF